MPERMLTIGWPSGPGTTKLDKSTLLSKWWPISMIQTQMSSSQGLTNCQKIALILNGSVSGKDQKLASLKMENLKSETPSTSVSSARDNANMIWEFGSQRSLTWLRPIESNWGSMAILPKSWSTTSSLKPKMDHQPRTSKSSSTTRINISN